jgi:hypothetical protein
MTTPVLSNLIELQDMRIAELEEENKLLKQGIVEARVFITNYHDPKYIQKAFDVLYLLSDIYSVEQAMKDVLNHD